MPIFISNLLFPDCLVVDGHTNFYPWTNALLSRPYCAFSFFQKKEKYLMAEEWGFMHEGRFEGNVMCGRATY